MKMNHESAEESGGGVINSTARNFGLSNAKRKGAIAGYPVAGKTHSFHNVENPVIEQDPINRSRRPDRRTRTESLSA